MKELMHALDNLTKSTDHLISDVRDGWAGMKEWYKDHFLLVRDVYENIVYPYISQNGIQSQAYSSSVLLGSSFVEIYFEKQIDSLLFYAAGGDVILSMNPEGVNSMRFAGNTTNNLAIRIGNRKTIYMRAAPGGDDISLTIWGLF
jgi:hypothetical protein